MTKEELQMLQALPLEVKIAKTKLRIEEWVRHWGKDHVYVSFSGGKDSTVLLHLVRQMYPDIPAMFVDTGLEYPEIKTFVKTFDNVDVERPRKTFKEVIEEFGYPMVSKQQASFIDNARHSTDKIKLLRVTGTHQENKYRIADKWIYLVDAPFNVSAKCCTYLKKLPARAYERRTKRFPFIGNLACESNLREMNYLKEGCNAFATTYPSSMPLGFWTEYDILHYIKTNNLKIAPVYGDIVVKGSKLTLTGVERTGCIFCGFGLHLEKQPNRFQRLERSHPKLHRYLMADLGFEDVCIYMNLPYTNEVWNPLDLYK